MEICSDARRQKKKKPAKQDFVLFSLGVRVGNKVSGRVGFQAESIVIGSPRV